MADHWCHHPIFLFIKYTFYIWPSGNTKTSSEKLIWGTIHTTITISHRRLVIDTRTLTFSRAHKKVSFSPLRCVSGDCYLKIEENLARARAAQPPFSLSLSLSEKFRLPLLLLLPRPRVASTDTSLGNCFRNNIALSFSLSGRHAIR